MATIGNIVLGLKVNSGAFNAGLNKAASGIKQFTNSISSAKAAITGIGAALAGAFAVNAIGNAISETIDKIDELADTASRLNTTTDALSRLHYAAELNSSSAETMDIALGKLSVVLGKIEDDGGASAQALAKLGLNAADLKKMDITVAFVAIAQAFSKLKSSADQSAVAQALFTKSGINLVDVLRLGADGLAESAAKSDAYGATIKQVTANQLSQAKDALTQLNYVFTGIKTTFVSELAPIITALSNRFLAWVEENGGFGSVIADGVEIAATAVGGLVDTFDLLLEKLKSIGVRWEQFTSLAGKLAAFAPGSGIVTGAIGIASALNQGGASSVVPRGQSAADKVKGFMGEVGALREKAKADADAKAADREKQRAEIKAAEMTKQRWGGLAKGVSGLGQGVLNSGSAFGKGIGGMVSSLVGNIWNNGIEPNFNPFQKKQAVFSDYKVQANNAVQFGTAEAQLANLQNRSASNSPAEKLQKTNDEQLKVAQNSDKNIERLVIAFAKLSPFSLPK